MDIRCNILGMFDIYIHSKREESEVSMKKIISLVLVMSLCFGLSASAYAYSPKQTVNREEFADIENGNFIIEYDNGHLYIIDGKCKIGGGIGRCSVQNKTFYTYFTRDQAIAALDAMKYGEGAVKSILGIMSGAWGFIGVTASVANLILTFFGGESAYQRNLENFVASGASTATIVYNTHCVNRGYVGGDPMYDYEIDSVSMTW